VLRGGDLENLASLPALVFCNACEAARVRRRRARADGARAPSRSGRSASVAEAFLAGGVANFIGTHWPVGDAAALTFSSSLYQDLVDGASLGKAVLAARQRVLGSGSVDWADYVFYGNPAFEPWPREAQRSRA
jgi:CHAT domain-containing protein